MSYPVSLGPAVPKKISEITASSGRVRVFGVVIAKTDGELEITDGSGEMVVVFDDPGVIRDVEVGSRVRIFGVPLVTEGGVELQGEIIQRMDGLKIELYEKVQKEWMKLEEELRRLNGKS
ncbi:MAG: hypothetical protein ACK4GQ_00015 [Candidatus Hadarchaeales archaeon]